MSETIPPNTRIAQYTIVSKIGEGGMGEVYRSRDSKLGRDVAIKVLPASLSENTDRLNRFEQEAQAAGALSQSVRLVDKMECRPPHFQRGGRPKVRQGSHYNHCFHWAFLYWPKYEQMLWLEDRGQRRQSHVKWFLSLICL